VWLPPSGRWHRCRQPKRCPGDREELEAAIAHELGHAWVFTHHAYLQTEELANQIAMRMVTRAGPERVYGKV
jgi:predicted Zn-dependent protease